MERENLKHGKSVKMKSTITKLRTSKKVLNKNLDTEEKEEEEIWILQKFKSEGKFQA